MPALKRDLLAQGIRPVEFEGVKATFYCRADLEPVDAFEYQNIDDLTSVAAE